MALRWYCGLLLVGWLGSSMSGNAASATRVAIVVESPDRADEWQALLSAALSTHPEIQLIERKELAALVEERAKSSLAAKAVKGPVDPMPAWTGVEAYLHVRKARTDATKWWVEAVDAATGSRRAAVEVPAETFPVVAKLAAALPPLLAEFKTPSAARHEGQKVAVLEFPGEGSDASALLTFAARLRNGLAASGLTILDRTLTQEIVIERNHSERGLVEPGPNVPFPGADTLIEVRATKDPRAAEVRMVSARDNRLKAGRNFPFDGPEGMAVVQDWIATQLDEAPPRNQRYQPTVEIEALEPFYRGLALYDAGQYPEAAGEFTRAYCINGKFFDAYQWEARCYDALGMEPLAKAVRRYAEIGLVGWGSSGGAVTSPTEIVTFLGVEDSTGKADDSLSGLTASVLTSSMGEQIQLPQTLQQLRREFDWLAERPLTTGTRWEEAPSFFGRLALRGQVVPESDHAEIQWTLRDTVSGQLIAQERSAWNGESATFESSVKPALDRLLATVDAPTPTSLPKVFRQVGDSPAELEKKLRSAKGMNANASLLRLALGDPKNSLVSGRRLVKEDSWRDGLDAFVNYGFNDWLITQLPPDSPLKRWREFMNIQSYFEIEPIGKLVTGEKPDTSRLLREFIARNPHDAPGLTARYALLYREQREVSPSELVQQSAALLADLQAYSGDFKFPDALIPTLTSLNTIARIANGDSELDLPNQRFPGHFRARFDEAGKPQVELIWGWLTNENQFVDLNSEERKREALAMIQINGRAGERREIRDKWLTDFPRSMVMASFTSSMIHEVNFWQWMPITHPFNWNAQVATIRSVIFYTADTYKYWVERASSIRNLDEIENLTWWFLFHLHERAFAGLVTDEEFIRIRDDLAVAFQEADKRLNRPGWTRRQVRLLKWQELTMENAREMTKDHLWVIGPELADRQILKSEIATAAKASFSSKPFNPERWWQRLRDGLVRDTFTFQELAQFHLEYHGELLELYPGPDLTGPEMNGLYDHAMTLFDGGYNREAEVFFRKIVEAPLNDLNRSEASETARLNATFRLAQLLRVSNRGPEALELAQRGLDHSHFPDPADRRAWREGNQAARRGLSEMFARLLGEMRFDPAKANLPKGVGVVSVPTPNVDNPELRIFYRTPLGTGANPQKPARVLLLLPPYNHSVLGYLDAEGPWARFADEHRLVLVAPHFYTSTNSDRASSQFCLYLYAQIWSGQALLEGLEKIAKITPIRPDESWIYAYGAGAAFASYFIRWKPELVSRVSLLSPGITTAYFQQYPRLKPFSAMKNLEVQVAIGTEDDYSANSKDRFSIAELYATALRGNGVKTHWVPIPGAAHVLTPEMEEISRKFLATP